jgi:hypothetical protein
MVEEWEIDTQQGKQFRGLTSELYRPDRRFPAKLVPTFEDRRCHVVSVKDPFCRILGCLDRRMLLT